MKKLTSHGVSHIILPIAVAAPAVIASDAKICLHSDKSECLQAHGSNKPISIALGTTSRWKITEDGFYNGSPAYFIKNSGGKCLLGQYTFVQLANSGCKNSNTNDIWEVNTDSGGVSTFRSATNGKYMGVEPLANNKDV